MNPSTNIFFEDHNGWYVRDSRTKKYLTTDGRWVDSTIGMLKHELYFKTKQEAADMVKKSEKTGMNDVVIFDVSVGDGKYRVVATNKTFHAYRHGVGWRTMTGDKLVWALASELDDARQTVTTMKKELDFLNRAGHTSKPDQGLLDQFASIFVTALSGHSILPSPEEVAKMAYDYAEAMGAERKRRMEAK